MGKPAGFLEYERKNAKVEKPLERISHFCEFRTPLSLKEQQEQGGRCMECGVPFCQNGEMLAHPGVRFTIWYRRQTIWFTTGTGSRPTSGFRRLTVFRNLLPESALLSVKLPAPAI